MKLTERERSILNELEDVALGRLVDKSLINFQYVENVDVCNNFKKLGYITGNFDKITYKFIDAKITKKGSLVFKLESL